MMNHLINRVRISTWEKNESRSCLSHTVFTHSDHSDKFYTYWRPKHAVTIKVLDEILQKMFMTLGRQSHL